MLRRMKPGAGPLKKGRRRKMRRLGIQFSQEEIFFVWTEKRLL